MRKKPELPEVERVKLKPIHGIRPGVWILSSLILAVLLLFFVVFMLPGILAKGSYVSFELNAKDVAIYQDGKYIGSSEGSVYYLEHGESEFSFRIASVKAGSITAKVPHRIFFTLFSHKLTNIEYSIENTPEIEQSVKEEFAKDTANWSKVIDYTDTYHYPPLFEEFAYNAINLGFSDISNVFLYGVLHITSEEMYSDFKTALALLESSSVEYQTPELDSLAETLYQIYEAGNTDITLASTENPDIKGTPTSLEMSNGIGVLNGISSTLNSNFFSYSEETITMGNSTKSSYPESNEAPVEITVPSFSIANRPVTEHDWAVFVKDNPYWAKDNIETLMKDGMVDENYLAGIVLSENIESNIPIRNISYYGAEAYCKWLAEKTGMAITIPTEAEWTVAALSAKGKPYAKSLIVIDNDGSSPSAMMGGLWEFTSTPYLPLSRLSDYSTAMESGAEYPYDDVIVKGGSWLNDNVGIDTVGVAEKSATSEYITLRIGIENDN